MSAYHIVHDLPGRMRIRYGHYAFSEQLAKGLECEIKTWLVVKQVTINPVTGSLLFIYDHNERDVLLELISTVDIDHFDMAPYLDKIDSDSIVVEQKQAKRHYVKDLLHIIVRRYAIKWLMPTPIANMATALFSLRYIGRMIDTLGTGHMNVSVLDGTSVLVSMLEGDFDTAGDIMFLLRISDLLQDYTQKKATLDLKNSLSMKIDRVWIDQEGEPKEIAMDDLQKDDIIIVHAGSMIPIDGEIVKGEALVNESSFTGEPLSKAVTVYDTVYAGSILEEGTLYIKVRNLQQDSRIAMIIDMVNNNANLKAGVQARAEHLADSIVPYSFLAFVTMWLLTGDLMRATSVLMVDYSCAIKMTTSISIISAMNEASHHSILVKGGKYLEAMAEADTIVFDKTGTLTNAKPIVKEIVSVHDHYSVKDVLSISACLEEHFPHSMANAIVQYALDQNVVHPEMHAEVEYIIAHGIASHINGKRSVIGSGHFVFEDEQVPKSPEVENILMRLQENGASSTIFLAIAGELVGIIGIYDPVKTEAKDVIDQLRARHFGDIVMLTGDGPLAAAAIAKELGIEHYQANVLPEDKSAYIIDLQEHHHKVVMVGDGVNDSPALSAADVAISMQDSSDIARELADITLVSSDLREIIALRDISKAVMKRITTNYRYILGFNSTLILLGALGILQPNVSAFLHNSSTFAFSAMSTQRLI